MFNLSKSRTNSAFLTVVWIAISFYLSSRSRIKYGIYLVCLSWRHKDDNKDRRINWCYQIRLEEICCWNSNSQHTLYNDLTGIYNCSMMFFFQINYKEYLHIACNGDCAKHASKIERFSISLISSIRLGVQKILKVTSKFCLGE